MSDSWVRTEFHAVSARRLFPQLPRPLRIIILAAAVALLGLIGWLWFRDSAFVRIERVSVSGLSGPGASRIRAALRSTALTMSTLDVDTGKLAASVSAYPQVHSLKVTTRGRHGVEIVVDEQVPAAMVTVGGRATVVDGNGLLLSQSTVPRTLLPTLSTRLSLRGGKVTSAGALAAVAVLGAAPTRLLDHVESATYDATYGVILQLRAGPRVYFGPRTQLAAKWNALISVLQSSGSAGASYIDLSDPEHPAAGVPAVSRSSATGPAMSAGTTSSGTAPAASTPAASTSTSSSTGSPSSGTAPTGSTSVGTAATGAIAGGPTGG